LREKGSNLEKGFSAGKSEKRGKTRISRKKKEKEVRGRGENAVFTGGETLAEASWGG